ncbi:thioredoxin-like negative regulator of GroEL [Bradyrhizobium sp. USDA 377]
MSYKEWLRFLSELFTGPLTLAKLIPTAAILIIALVAVLRLILEGTIKAKFDRELEQAKAMLDLQKQQLLKDFGLFAEKRHELNRDVYVKLRTAYRSVNKAVRAAFSPADTTMLTPTDLDEFLTALDVPLLDRKDLVRLQEIAPQVVCSEIARRTPWFRNERAGRDIRIAIEAVFTNELFLDRAVLSACNAVVELLKQSIPLPDKREAPAALDEVPQALARVRAAMRLSLLGEQDVMDDDLEGYAEDPDDAFTANMRNMEPPTIGGFIDFENDFARLISRGSTVEVQTNIERIRKASLAAAGVEAATSEQKLEKATALVELGRIDEAVAQANLLLKNDPGDARALPVICEGLLRKGDNLKALEVIGRYLAAHPADADGWYLRGRANWGGFSDSAEDFRTALKHNPDHYKARSALANILFRRKDHNGALQEADRCLMEAPHDLTAQIVRLEILADMHRWDSILKVCDQALQIDPRHPRTIKLKGDALNILNCFADAASFANKILTQSPECPEALAVRARASINRAEFEPALFDADAALKRDPRNADAKLIRAEALLALQRWDDALGATTEAYLAAEPYSREARTCLDSLKIIQKVKSKALADGASALTDRAL